MTMKPEYKADLIDYIHAIPDRFLDDHGLSRSNLLADATVMDRLWTLYQKSVEEYEVDPDYAVKDAFHEVFGIPVEAWNSPVNQQACRATTPSGKQKDAEWEALIQFARDNKDDFGPLTEEWELCAPNIYQRQLLSLWTAYCLHNDFTPDTADYDQAIDQIWEIISDGKFPEPVELDDDTEYYCRDSFYRYMVTFLV